MLYDNYPIINYNGYDITDISIRLDIIRYIKHIVGVFTVIEFSDTNTLDSLAFDYYGDSNLYWILMVLNDIIDPFHDLPLRPNELSQYIINKYVDPNGVHHYEDGDKNVVESNYPLATPITNTIYEEIANEKKRVIKIMSREYIPQIITELDRLLNG